MMSEDQFKTKLTHIDEQAGALQERVDGYRDQELAKLFIECEWSQEEIAGKLSKHWDKEVTQQWVSYRLRFGRFISFFTTSGCEEQFVLPRNLSERTFRRLWDATKTEGENFSGHRSQTVAAKEDEERRFKEVIGQLRGAGISRARKQITKAIAAELGSVGTSRWVTPEEVRDRIVKHFSDGDVLVDDVRRALRQWRPPTEKTPYRVEQAVGSGGKKFRLVRVKKVVSPQQLQQMTPRLLPLIKDLLRECKKDSVTISIAHLLGVANRIEKVLESTIGQVEEEEVNEVVKQD